MLEEYLMISINLNRCIKFFFVDTVQMLYLTEYLGLLEYLAPSWKKKKNSLELIKLKQGQYIHVN